MKLVLAITGASGAIYPKIFLTAAKKIPDLELHVVASQNAKRIFYEELNINLSEYVPNLKSPNDFDVPYVSGSARMNAMVILPCSSGMLGRIAHGVSDDAITRAADVFLKEKRKLILVPRETPLSLIHLRNLVTLAEAGADIIPAMPSFYSGQKNLEEVCSTVVARIFDHLHLPFDSPRWKEK